MVSLRWSSAIDFDLGALYEARDGREGFLYYDELGKLNEYPFIEHSGDDGDDEKDDDCEEAMRITKLDQMKFVWFFLLGLSESPGGSVSPVPR
jgi:uncharacterized protein involved in tellurium resistance